MTEQIVTGIFTLVGALGGVLVGLFGERWVRTWGDVLCEVEWQVMRTAGSLDSAGGVQVQERRLYVSFLNRKDIEVTVWEMRVVFYKGGKPLEDWAQPSAVLVYDRSQRIPLDRVSLPPRNHVAREIVVTPDESKIGELEGADRAEFVAHMVGAKDQTKDLSPPWRYEP